MKHFLILICLVACATAFQNCGGGMSSRQPASLTQKSDPEASAKIDGAVFPRDPATDSGNFSLALNANFDAQASRVSIERLLSGGKYLANGVVFLNSDDAFPTQIANPKSGLVYPPSDPRFLQVNAYYHLDRFTSALKSGGRLQGSNYGVNVIAHCLASRAVNNAYYDFGRRVVCLGYAPIGGEKIWAANDADVIVHEFGHSVNHNVSSDDIFASSVELGALDEALSDLWAYSQNGQAAFAKFYGQATVATPTLAVLNGYRGLRNLASVDSYPQALTGLPHADSVLLSSAVVEMAQASAAKPEALHAFNTRVLESLQAGWGFQEIVLDMIDSARAVGLNAVALKTAFEKRGLIRKDELASLQLDSVKPVFVVDSHSPSTLLEGGNCNGVIDRDETVLLFPNLKNVGAKMVGQLRLQLVAVSSSGSGSGNAVEVLAGADVGSVLKIASGQAYVDHVRGKTRGSKEYLEALGLASFAVKGLAVGTHQFNLKIAGMNTVDNSPNVITLPFPITVGNEPTSTSCADEATVLP